MVKRLRIGRLNDPAENLKRAAHVRAGNGIQCRGLWLFVVRGFLYLSILLIVGCRDGERLRSAPAALGGLELHHQLSGTRALGALDRLHGGAGIELEEAWIAHYGESPSAILYVGVAKSRSEAAKLLTAMRHRIDTEETPFRPVHQLRLFRTDVFLMSGQGQLHFLFREGKRVVWLSADPSIACQALADAVGVGGGGERCKVGAIITDSEPPPNSGGGS